MQKSLIFYLIFYITVEVKCGYPPIGDEVQAGSVLLPASRRGRYLANIVRRQAVDGTGIKFNKDADRMNAEAKKKVDVLSEELLPYIIAEQERRTTLYKRVMTAIQNGEKGVTIAEIRNKPPAIIRKGLMYRCPTNRAPKEPDGSGIIMCEDNIEPTPIMYESCLSAEDKELYVAENKYFFCNRHKVEGPDLPRNGSTVIGCAPCERTSLNYTSAKCALEDTDDVVVHYRYYPDRTYKFVTELDPDREVCEHWNPCQIGYIFSLPSPDQATSASELWHDYVVYDEEDSNKENVKPPGPYIIKKNRIPIPPGFTYYGIGKHTDNKKMVVVSLKGDPKTNKASLRQAPPLAADAEKAEGRIEVTAEEVGKYVKVTLRFKSLRMGDVTSYYVIFQDKNDKNKFKYEDLIELEHGVTKLTASTEEVLPGQKMNTTQVNFTCSHCSVIGMMVRGADGTVHNIEASRYKVVKINDKMSSLDLELGNVGPANLGDYFINIMLEDGAEEKVKAFTIKVLKANRHVGAAAIGEHYDNTVNYGCADCEINDIMCRGESMLSAGRVSIIPANKVINFNFPSFEDANACVYLAVFTKGDKKYQRIVGVIDIITINPAGLLVAPPTEGEQFEQEVAYTSKAAETSIEKVTLNGVPLITNTRRVNVGAIAFFVLGDNTVTLRITEYIPTLEGVEQAVFIADGEKITKTLMEIGKKEEPVDAEGDKGEKADVAGEAATQEAAAGGGGAGGGDAATPAPDGAEAASAAPDAAADPANPDAANPDAANPDAANPDAAENAENAE